MPQFMLLLHGDPKRFEKFSPDEMQRAIERYMAWTKRPFVVDTKRLAPDPGRVIRNRQVTDGPYSESKEVLGGFYLINAAHYDEAVQLALEHPHLEYSGTLEIRQLHPM
jgi:hypothetical protein